MKPVTKENLKAFASFMSQSYDAEVVTPKSPLIAFFRSALRAMGIDKVDQWLSKWSMTLPGMVWLCFVPGDSKSVSLLGQIMVICHEFVHVLQWREDRAKFAARYVFRDSERSHYEAEALHANIEMAYALGLKPDIKKLAQMLLEYRVRKEDVAVTEKHLRIYDMVARTGARTNKVCKKACQWWEIG